MRQASRSAAFTLLELLVSMAVLILLIGLVVQLLNGAGATVTSGHKQIAADSQARAVFDRMAADFARMPLRSDLDYIFAKSVGSANLNDAFYFYTESAGYTDGTSPSTAESSCSLVGYRINPGGNPSQPWVFPYSLDRLGKQLTWDKGATPGGAIFLALTGTGPVPSSTIPGAWPATLGIAPTFTSGSDADYSTLSESVFRLEYCFQLTDGSYSIYPILQPPSPNVAKSNVTALAPGPANDSTQGYAGGSRWYDTNGDRGYLCQSPVAGAAVWTPIGMGDVSAIVVAIAILDNDSRKLVQNMAALSAALPDPEMTGTASLQANPAQLMASLWQSEVTSPHFASDAGGIPAAAASQVRIYQQFFYLGK